MDSAVQAFFGIAFIGFFLYLIAHSDNSKPGQVAVPPAPVRVERQPQFHKRPSVMNKSEAAFLYELQKQLPEGYYIFPKMRMADILETNNGIGYYQRRNYILPKHIDFLVCDRHFRPVVAIEVNGSSHNRQDRQHRDKMVKEIFDEAKMPLEFVNVGTSFEQSIASIRAKLN